MLTLGQGNGWAPASSPITVSEKRMTPTGLVALTDCRQRDPHDGGQAIARLALVWSTEHLLRPRLRTTLFHR